MEQRRITETIQLLDIKGSVVLPGWCEHNRYIYNRKAIKANPSRIKEWDFYQITDERITCQLTVADISFGGAATLTVFDRVTGERFSGIELAVATFGSFDMPSDAMKPHKIERRGMGGSAGILVTDRARYLSFSSHCKDGKITADLELNMPQGLESLTMAVPFSKKGHFYLNQKINCMPAKGSVRVGDRIFTFDPNSAFALLDWGRGVWPYKTSWYWGNGSAKLDDGAVFGFEIGWGFGIMEDFTENCLFYNGRAHKIGRVFLDYDKQDLMKPWIFSSDDGRFAMTMTPEFDNFTSTRVGAAGSICHQVFGKFNGFAVLDNGKRLDIKNMTAFCEHSDNRR